MTVLAQHIAALLLHHVRREHAGRLSVFAGDLPARLSARFDIEAPHGLVEDALAILTDIGGCRNLESPLTGTFCRLEGNSAEYFFGSWPSFVGEWGQDDEAEAAYARERKEKHEKYPILNTYFQADDQWIDRIVERLSEMDIAALYYGDEAVLRGDPVPASDRVVTLDDNQRQSLIEPLKELSQELRESNSTRVALGEDADRVSAEVEAGLALAGTDRIRLSAIISVLLKPLRYIAEKFSGAAIGTLATELIKALLKLV